MMFSFSVRSERMSSVYQGTLSFPKASPKPITPAAKRRKVGSVTPASPLAKSNAHVTSAAAKQLVGLKSAGRGIRNKRTRNKCIHFSQLFQNCLLMYTFLLKTGVVPLIEYVYIFTSTDTTDTTC